MKSNVNLVNTPYPRKLCSLDSGGSNPCRAMFNRLVIPMRFGLLCLVLLMLLIWRLSVPAHVRAQAQASSVPSPKRILILYSYGDSIPAYQKATPAFRSVMTAAGVSLDDMFFEYLDLQRKNDPEYRRKLADLFRHKYAGRKIDLIVTLHTVVLSFLSNEGKGVFPEAPVLSYLVAPEAIGTNNTGRRILHLPINLDFKGTLELALEMFPQTRRVVFVNGINEGDLKFEREAKRVSSLGTISLNSNIPATERSRKSCSGSPAFPSTQSSFMPTSSQTRPAGPSLPRRSGRGSPRLPTLRFSASSIPSSAAVSSAARY